MTNRSSAASVLKQQFAGLGVVHKLPRVSRSRVPLVLQQVCLSKLPTLCVHKVFRRRNYLPASLDGGNDAYSPAAKLLVGMDSASQKVWTQAAILGVAPCATGCCSGMVGAVVVQPIDTLKVRLQLVHRDKKALSPMSLLKDLAARRRLFELYDGLSAALLRQVVYGTARLGFFSTFEGSLQRRAELQGTTLGFSGRAVAGLSAGAVAAVIGNPTEVALIRMQSDGTKPLAERARYTSVLQALVKITRAEGVMTLWRGTIPTIVRAMSTNFGQLAFFSETKHQLALRTTLSEKPRAAIAAATGGFFGAFLSQPFDFVKTRLQYEAMSASPSHVRMYKGTLDCFVKVTRNEGLLRFYRDFWPYFWRVIPQSIIALFLNDSLLRVVRSKLTA